MLAYNAPLFRWVGSKRRIAQRIVDVIGSVRGRYHEPFCGSAAVFLALRPKLATLSDLNAELINFWQVVKGNNRDQWDGGKEPRRRLIHTTQHLVKFGTDASCYAMVRAATHQDPIRRAARFWYLQATSFNGLWRENAGGIFNVPYGFRLNIEPPDYYDFDAANEALARTRVVHQDAMTAMADADRGDLVYLDPPYAETFADYVSSDWTPLHLAEMIDLAFTLKRRGVRIVASDNDTKLTRALYRSARCMHRFKHPQSVAASARARTPRSELLVEL